MLEENITNAVTALETKKTTKPKRTDEEKLSDCYVQMSKLLEQQTATRQKGKDIDNRISKLNSKIQEYENKALYKICKELNISVKDIITCLERIPKGKTFDEIANRVFQDTSNNNGGIT